MILTYKGIKINFNSYGQGEPIIFLHGFLENETMWKAIIPSFSNHYRCTTIDLLGHGKTECLGYVHTMEQMAKAVKIILDHLDLTKICLVGHSMGGYVALALIEQYPEIVAKLVLLNSTSFPDNEERKLTRTKAIDIVKKNPNAYTRMAIANLFAEKNRSQFTREIEDIKAQASKTSLQGIISALEGMKIRKDRSHILSAFEGQKIIFSGKEDPVLPFLQNEIESKTCQTTLIVFSGGHMTHIEKKEMFVKELQKFLKNY